MTEDDSLLLVAICAHKNGGTADLLTANSILALYDGRDSAAILSLLQQLIFRRADAFRKSKLHLRHFLLN